MKYVRLGHSGLQVSKVLLGCMSFGDPGWREWVLTEEQSTPLIREAVELGINYFDTADVYSFGRSEEIVGNALKELAPRDEVVIATKLGLPMGKGPLRRGLSRKRVFDSVDAALRRLQTDYIDLLQIHRWDPETPAEETIDALDDVVKAGKVRYLGATTVRSWQLAKMLFTQDIRGRSRFVSLQNHYNLLYREDERELIPLCIDQGIAVIPWGPLAKGYLAGNRARGTGHDQTLRGKTDDLAEAWYETTETDAILAGLKKVAERHGRSMAEIAIAWIASRPGIVAPTLASTRLGHMAKNVAAIDITLNEEDVKDLESPYRPREIVGAY